MHSEDARPSPHWDPIQLQLRAEILSADLSHLADHVALIQEARNNPLGDERLSEILVCIRGYQAHVARLIQPLRWKEQAHAARFGTACSPA